MMLPSDKELDKLIRDAAEESEATSAVPNWEEMQVLLDIELPVKKEPRRRPFFLLLLPLLLLILGGGYFYFNKTTLPGKTTPTEKQKEMVATVKIKTSDAAAVAGSVKTNTPTSNTPQGENLLAKANKTNNMPATTISAAASNNKQINKSNHLKNRRAGFSKMNTTSGDIGETDLTPTPADPVTEKETTFNPATSQVLPAQPVTGNEAKSIPSKNADTVTTASNGIAKTENNKKADTSNNITGKKNKTTDNRKRRLEISAVYAPELTTIKLSHFDKPGSNYGILISYEVFKNISIQTGVLRSRKNYIANGEDFKTNYTPTPPFKLASVKGYCNMYEVPLNIKYQLTRNKKINISAIAGISSYFMTNEFYTYKYTSNTSGYSWSKGYSSQKNYWFSLATIGIGFDKAISKKLNAGVTPFAKIPFKGMGTGSLKLLSTGINFSLSYRPAFSKKH